MTPLTLLFFILAGASSVISKQANGIVIDKVILLLCTLGNGVQGKRMGLNAWDQPQGKVTSDEMPTPWPGGGMPLDALYKFQMLSEDTFGDLGNRAAALVYQLEVGADGLGGGAGGVTSTNLDDSKLDDGKLKLTVTHRKQMVGEMATPSHTPLAWTLEETVVYTLVKDGDNAMKLMTQGLGISGFRESRDLYKGSQCKEKCELQLKEKHHNLADIVECERKVLFEYFKAQWDTMKSEPHLKDGENKVARVLLPMYGSWIMRKTINSKGSDAWPKIIYGMATIPKTAADVFRFYKDGGKIRVSMWQHETDGEGYLIKNGADFTPQRFAKDYSRGESFAPSGMNFAAMVAAGRPDLGDAIVKGGIADKILKLAEPCTQGEDSDKYGDKTAKCKGKKNGRVIWQ